MSQYTDDLYTRHISTHSKHSEEDRAAVFTLENFLLSGGRINPQFSRDDKWPNHDGTFEFVSDPDISRIPEQNFIVQIKGTSDYKEKDGEVSFRLRSLAFPAFIAHEVTADPGILFVVLDPCSRGRQRVFWKYISQDFIHSIDFKKNDSTTIKFSAEDEIINTDEGINMFCNKLQHIVDFHLFINKLNGDALKAEDAIRIVEVRCEDISDEIRKIANGIITRDNASRKIVNCLYDLCYAVLVLNAIKAGYKNVNEKFAWELAQLNIGTRYLSNFLKGLKYIASRVPEKGQSERLMLKYYNYLWEIRRFLRDYPGITVLTNLEDFPLYKDTLDEEYYTMVASSICNSDLSPRALRTTRYYIQKKTPFYFKGERYFEITLQLAGLYATKFNRITVYSRQDISTEYSIQIAYTDAEIKLWGANCRIKILTNWRVSVFPSCLNKVGKILKIDVNLSGTYGEYNSLMDFLTRTGMNLFELINLRDVAFAQILNQIYYNTNTQVFKNVLMRLRQDYSLLADKPGKYTIRYILLNLREETIEAVLPGSYHKKCLSEDIYLSSKCYPFEKRPFISNLAGRKTSKGNVNDILEITADSSEYNIACPYLKIENLIHETGELYFDADMVGNQTEIKAYNNSLDSWELSQGYRIIEEDGLLTLDSYESTTIFILNKLQEFSKKKNRGQKELNKRYLNRCNINFEDPIKKKVLEKLFVDSQVMIIYGAAGTGKTMLMNYISNMMNQCKKLFLTKTHAALQNLRRCIDNPGQDSDFISIDSYTKTVSLNEYDLILIDECSIIDNRTMKRLLEKTGENTLLVVAGDIYQIESIDFGNWFYYAKDIINADGASVELLSTWRTDSRKLKDLWDEVRHNKPTIVEKLAIDGPFSENIGESMFIPEDEDEIVLCLNYDGKFGLNNMNLYFQSMNTCSEVYTWAEWTFKIGDPIIFLDNRRSSLLYNNLKGKIVDISKRNDSAILFTLDIDTILTERQCRKESFEFVSVSDHGTRIRLEVVAKEADMTTDEDITMTIIPFQIAYAVSIHKAQGLEYKSVKIVIPSYNAEKITHSVFYTAITRAKEKLKIYWSAETMKSVIDGFDIKKSGQRTLEIVNKKLEI